jgi:hypothetical protein
MTLQDLLGPTIFPNTFLKHGPRAKQKVKDPVNNNKFKLCQFAFLFVHMSYNNWKSNQLFVILVKDVFE